MTLRPALPAAAVFALLAPTSAFAQPAAIKGLESECRDTILEGCEVLSSGYVGLKFGPRTAFQTQAGHTVDYGVGGGVALYVQQDDEWALLASDFAGFVYETPRLSEGEPILLHVPGMYAGTGAMNADLLFRYDDAAESWHPIDIMSWHDTVGDLLPEGHEIWKGVDFDFNDWFYAEYNARTPLWKDGDANCCPRGGWAIIHFDIVDDVLVPRSADYLPPESSK